jgi:hypothetical protein
MTMPADSNASAGSRPSEYTAEIGTAICGQLAEGKSLRAICADPGMPTKATVLGWLACREEFRKQWGLAQFIALEFLADEVLEIIDDVDGDWIETVRGGRVVSLRDPQHLHRCRLRAQVRSWMADHMAGLRAEKD